MQEIEDAILLKRFAAEETRRAAFTDIVKKYQERIYWLIRKLVTDHEDANDIVQNVFIKVWKALPEFRQDAQLYTWIYRIATNESLTFLKNKNKRFFVSLDDVQYKLAEKLNQDPLFTGDKIQLKLQQAVMKLPPQQRTVFNLKYFEGKKYEEIAEIMGLSVGGLKANYHHAVKKIEKYLLTV